MGAGIGDIVGGMQAVSPMGIAQQGMSMDYMRQKLADMQTQAQANQMTLQQRRQQIDAWNQFQSDPSIPPQVKTLMRLYGPDHPTAAQYLYDYQQKQQWSSAMDKLAADPSAPAQIKQYASALKAMGPEAGAKFLESKALQDPVAMALKNALLQAQIGLTGAKGGLISAQIGALGTQQQMEKQMMEYLTKNPSGAPSGPPNPFGGGYPAGFDPTDPSTYGP